MLHAGEPRNLKRCTLDSTLVISDITVEAARLSAFDKHEHVWCGQDPESGLTAIVAIHNTRLGPALGGTRIWPHESFEAALTDALRLSRGMTYKSAVAGLPLGGGKAVIIADPMRDKTTALLTAYAEMVARLEGQFITAEDVGMTLQDADFLRGYTTNVVGTSAGGSGNPSPVTAEGVFLGIKAALRHQKGSSRLSGLRVAVQGLGSVGWSLCEKLYMEGAELIVTDLDAGRIVRAYHAFEAETVVPEEIIAVKADIFAPCALGGVISSSNIPSLKFGIIAGSANNQLVEHEDARLLMERGILYAPDYVINAGGLINAASELSPQGYDPEAVTKKLAKIPATLTEIFRRSEQQQRPTNDVAAEMAMERIAR